MAQQMTPEMQNEIMAATMDEKSLAEDMVSTSVPVGTYSKSRQKTLAKTLNKFHQLLDDGVVIEVAFENVKRAEMPQDLVRSLVAIRDVLATFAEIYPEEAEEAESLEVETLTDDSSISMAIRAIEYLMKNRDFKRFLREDMASDEEVEEPVEEEVGSEEDMTSEQSEVKGQELSILENL